jgi:hypothetical protein
MSSNSSNSNKKAGNGGNGGSRAAEGSKWDQVGTTHVTSRAEARRVVRLLEEHARHDGAFHACDTEVVDLDLAAQPVVGHGRIICFSIFADPLLDLGSGPRLWVGTSLCCPLLLLPSP